MKFRTYLWPLLALLGAMSWCSLALAQTPTCIKPNVLIILNKSSNMNAAKWNQARIALGQLAQARDQNTRFGLETFDTSAQIRVPFQDNALQSMALIVIQTQPGGQSNHKRAIATARAYLTAEITRDTATTRSYSVVLVTDGTSNDGDIATDIAALRSITTANGRRKDVRTFVMGVSPGTNGSTLNSWASSGGTNRYYTTGQVTLLSTQLQQNEPQPRPEQCNGQDDDCDGQTDENLERACLATCPGGATTAAGTQTCQNGQFGPCQVQKRPEVCNGRDDDCNGQVDDNLTPLTCQSACGTGTMTCTNGRWVNCTAPQATPETCDGKDNDCDGEIDERCPCRPGQTRACGTDAGECTKGTQACQNGQWSPICTGEGRPTAEQCDNKDNDCDGLVDENVRRLCNNACGRGIETCTAGKWANCTAPQPKTETCNGSDDDCDGIVDEGCSCNIGQTRPCGTNTGTCRQGINICTSGQWSTNCFNSQGPTAETCDRQDNDCDGSTDENLTRPCTNPCGAGTERCSFGRWIACSAPTPQSEVCDNKDNDCDGQIDENITQPCYTGGPGTQGVGECIGGVQTCRAGKFDMCAKEVIPTKEVCGDSKDNDCDGQIDNGCPCKPGQTQLCGINIGACSQGKQACVNGQWGPCSGNVGPKPEVCNGQDDNCDGLTDEALTRNCNNACGSGIETCLRGAWANCTATQPRRELCGNNLDDDCDGQIDENCPCRVGQTRPCGSTVGECKAGVQDCVGGAWSDVCKGGVSASPEICDGKDNNCDGQIDNGVSCGCQDGTTRSCGSATGECKSGVQTCTNSTWGQCVGAVEPVKELCDKKDNDCDGQVDEDFATLGQGCTAGAGPCIAKGTNVCAPDGKSVVCNAVPRPPIPEICGNNIDDNCNGQTDENCPCRTGQTRPCGGSDVGECKKGIETCVANNWSAVCIGEVKPTAEACDGKDNDCNGKIDDTPACVCKDGEQRPCYTGPPGTSGVGNCISGAQICSQGKFGPCQKQVLPQAETCDGRDNDCDGTIDENLDRACQTPCGTGRQRCFRGSYGPCPVPPPTPEVCDGLDNDCNGQTDEGAPCPPDSACLQGKCIPNPPDAGPDAKPECLTDADCPENLRCQEGRCVPNVQPDTAPDTAPDTSPDATPDTTPPVTTCTVNKDCGTGNVCRWGRCHTACTQNAECPNAQSSTCLLGLCVPQCVADKHCASGQVCRAGWCRAACRSDIDCTDSKSCIGFSCVAGCSGDADCAAAGGHCLDGKSCLPRCNLAADCPNGFACEAGKCIEACSSFVKVRLCGEGKLCSASRCEDDCSQNKCPATGNFDCKANLCVPKCASDAECQPNEACLALSCVARCSIQDDCPTGTRCSEGLCFPACQTKDDCPSGRACSEGRCVDACQASSPAPPPPVDAGPADQAPPAPAPIPEPPPPPVDAGPAEPPAPDTGTPDAAKPDAPTPGLCANSAQACAGDSCHVTCNNAATCKTGYVCGTSCDGCTDKVCLPPCRVDVDCPSKFFCHRGVCRLGCSNDAQCDAGEQCTNGRCTQACNVDTDCPLPQVCENKLCVDPDPLKKDRGDVGKPGIPKMKLAGGCGCQTTAQNPASWLFSMLLLGLLLVPITRRRA